MAKVKKSKQKAVEAKKHLTRKEQRKQKALQKKENKRIFFSKKPKTEETATAQKRPLVLAPNKSIKNNKKVSKTSVKAPLNIEQLLSSGDGLHVDDNESIASDFSDEEVDAKIRGSGVLLKKNTATRLVQNNIQMPKRGKVQQTRPDFDEQHRRDIQRQKELEQAARKQRLKQLHLQNDEDDIEIARLEKKLKLNRTKDKNRLVRKMFNDGLDYALDLCLDDEEERAKQELKEKRKNAQMDVDNFEENSMDDSDEIENDDDHSASEEEEDDNNEHSEDTDSDENEPTLDTKTQYKEDIYGRKRDEDGNIVKDEPSGTDAGLGLQQKYIPPHLRAKQAITQDNENSKQAEILTRLRKQCKGLLNRLSEFNLHKIATGIEELYMRNSRYNMNETVTGLLNEALISKTMTKDRMVQEHMVLLAYLHAHIGSEIGAHFLQSYIKQFAALTDDQEIFNIAIEDKRLNNIILVLSYMYIFRIYDHRLLLEIVDKLARNLCEKTIECMLVIFQSVGFKLRKDDPVAFKQMIQNLQQRIAAAPLEMKENLRLKFMVDTLNAVKNNNINKIPQFDPELAENLRKRLKAMLRNDKYVTTLNIAMADLLRADQVGKWWIVGSAWSGNINDVAAAQKQSNDSSSGGQRFSEQLLKLAKQQKMNTDERRNIFCIIMSAEDYIDAFEKILHLALKDQRVIAYVIMHCCLNEARPNPYYAHLALKFCNYNRKYQLAFQFAAWDRINDIEKLSKQQIKNLGQFLLHLIVNGGLALSVLKIVDFLQLQKSSFLLMREVVVGLLLHSIESEVHEVFERIAKNAKLHNFKNSLRLFMQHFLLKQDTLKINLTEDQLILVRKRIDYVDKLLSYVDL